MSFDVGGPRIRLDFAASSYMVEEQLYDDPADVAFLLRLTGQGGIARSPGGALSVVAAGPRIIPGAGIAPEPASENKIRGMFNLAPVSTAGWGLLFDRPAGATLTVVDDMAELYAAQSASGEYLFRDLIDQGRMNGKVVRAYNPHPTSVFYVPAAGGTGVAGPHAFSAYVRCLAGGAFLQVFGAAGGVSPTATLAQWQYVEGAGTADGNRQVNLGVQPGSTVYIIGLQLEAGTVSTSLIEVRGKSERRVEEAVEVNAASYFSRPHTLVVEVYLADKDFSERQIMTLCNPGGEEVAVVRWGEANALSTTQSGPYAWRMRLPRVREPGRIRIALRVSPIGRTMGANGRLTHDPFRAPPTGLSRLLLGFSQSGDRPMSGWVRSIEVYDEVDDAQLEALCAAPAGAMLFDMDRYVSPSGNDANDGKTPATAWRTLAIASNTSQVPLGTHVWLERGGVWAETLIPVNYCTYRPYGAGERPTIGTGQLYGIDSSGGVGWRVQGLRITGATQRAVNGFGTNGVFLDDIDMPDNGSAADNNAICVAIRGNSRAPVITPSNGSPAPVNASIGTRVATESAAGGRYVLTCIQGGAGTASRWRLVAPNGSVLSTTIAGNTNFNNGLMRFIVLVTGTGPQVGGVFYLDLTTIENRPYPTNGRARDFGIRHCAIRRFIGAAAGDDAYVEGVMGVVICEANTFEAPRGQAADAFQVALCCAPYLEIPTHTYCRNNRMDMTGAQSGKGAIVVQASSSLIEGNYVRFGNNFCLGIDTPNSIIRYNSCNGAQLNSYSWGIAVGAPGPIDNVHVYENRIKNCRRSISFSASNGSATTGPARTSIIVERNIGENADVMLFADRPIAGRMFGNIAINCTALQTINTNVVPVGGSITGFKALNNMRYA